MSDSWRDSEGQVIDGQFSLVKHLAATDHSVLFSTLRGKDKNEKAAIKFIQADASNADAQLARWKQAAQLSHPNLIKVYESGRCQLAGLDLLYVVMEQTQENLAEFLPQRALSTDETRDMLEPFIDALTYLHGKGLAHGRIKPGNILAIDDQLKLSSDSICREGDVQIGAGKPEIYVAPETNGRATTAGDSWSLGATLVESLTQRRPEETSGDPGIPDTVPQPFLDIAQNTLRRDPKARWTIAEISNRLNPKAESEPAKTAALASPSPSTSASPATAAKPVAAASPSSVAVAEPPKPSSSRSAGAIAATASAATATAVAVAPARVEPKAVPLAKATKSIDPLSVPLSTVAPKFDAGKSSSKGWYIAILLLIAFAAGAWYTVPEVREFTQGVISSSPSATPSAQPASTAPASSAPTAQPAARARATASRQQARRDSCSSHEAFRSRAHAESRRDRRTPASCLDAAVRKRDAEFNSGQRTYAAEERHQFGCVSEHFRNTRRGIDCTASGDVAHGNYRVDKFACRSGYTGRAAQSGDARDFFASAQHNSWHRPRDRQGSRERVGNCRNSDSRVLTEPILRRRSRAGREAMGFHTRENFRPGRAERMACAI